MHKLLLTFAASAMAISAMAAGAITEQPEGTLYSTVAGSTDVTYFLYNGTAPAINTSDCGFVTEIVVNGKDVYLHNVLHDYAAGDAWIKGTENAEGIVEFSFPQDISADGKMTINLLRLTSTDTGDIYVANESDNTLRMRWDNWTLTQIKPEGAEGEYRVGLLNADGAYTGYAFEGLSLSVVDTAPVTLPADADLEAENYSCSYTDKNNTSRTAHIVLYREVGGPGVWISGLNSEESDQIVHGELNPEGNIVLESGQFMGYTMDYFTYFYGGRSDNGELSWTDNATLRFEDDKIVTDDILIINQGNNRPILGFSLSNVVMTRLNDLVRTPSAPEIPGGELAPEQYSESEGVGVAAFNIWPVDVNGEALDEERLFYSIYFDDELQQFEINGATSSEIPYGYFDFENWLIVAADEFNMVSFDHVLKSFSVETVYHNPNGEITKSELVKYEFENSGIANSVAQRSVASTQYYNLQGTQLAKPEGVCIVRTVYTDGTVTVAKIFKR